MIKNRILKCVEWKDSGNVSNNLVFLLAARENQICDCISDLKLKRPLNGYILVSGRQTTDSKVCIPTLLLDDNNQELPECFQNFLLDCYIDAHNAAADFIERKLYSNR